MAGKMSEPVGETLVLAREGRPKCFAGELFEVFVQPRGSGVDIFHDDTGGLFLVDDAGGHMPRSAPITPSMIWAQYFAAK